MSLKIKGLDELSKKLEDMKKKSKDLEGTKTIPFNKLFDNEFIKKHTDFHSVDEMFEKSDFKCDSDENFKKNPDGLWDEYIRNNTKFSNWNDMISEAGKEYLSKQLGF